MINIRYNIFETNSSSMHALVVMTKSQYNDWQDDKFIVLNNEQLVTPDTLEIRTRDEVIEDILESNGYDNEDIEEMSDGYIDDLAARFGYLPADNYNSIEGEFEDYIILSAYIND